MDMDRAILPLERELIERVGWFIKLRWYAAAAIFTVPLLGKFILQFNLPVLTLCAIGVAVFIYNLAFRLYFPRLSRPKGEEFGDTSQRTAIYISVRFVFRFANLQIALDWISLGTIAHCSGGIQSPMLMFFIFHLLIASILLPRWDCCLHATIAVFIVAAIAFLEYFQLLPHISIRDIPDARFSDIMSVMTSLFFFATTLYIAVFSATSVAATLRSKERNLAILQADLQEAYSDLEESAKARSQFILTITHELRAPLAAVQSMLGVIAAGYVGGISEKGSELIKRSERRILALLELVGNLLDLAREQMDGLQSQPVDMDLNDVVAKVIDGIQNRAEAKGVSLAVNMPSDHVTLEGDEKDMERLLGNLISNAVKYTLVGGEASLTVEASEDRVNLTVADTGIGIPKEAIPKLFTEFFRARNARESTEYGTGLGLAIVKRIVDEHKGDISVKSELGKGTQFFVLLPRRSSDRKESYS
jgi:signal transduction histidine kinase